MGLPLWSSVGYGNEENKPTTKPQSSAPRRSPIQRSFPARGSTIVDPDTGSVRYVRRPVRRRTIPPQVPVAQAQSEFHQPAIRSPLVPSLGAIGNIISRAQRVLGHAHVEMDRLLARQYTPHLRTSARTDRPLIDELDCILRAARDFSENTREQITYLVRWERNLLRGELIGPQVSTEFHDELEALIVDCENNRNDIKRRLEEFQSWALDAREDLSLRRVQAHGTNAPQPSARSQEPRTRFLNEAPVARTASSRPRNVPTINLQNGTTLPTLDGLGDRLRSASPEHDPNADAWDTMRMTLEPDDRLPSTASSFTTAAASASFSAPSDRSGSTSAPLSAGSSRTDLSMASFEDDDCGPYDDSPEPSDMPEVIPSPLFRDMSGRNNGNDLRHARADNLDFGPPSDRRLPTLYGERVPQRVARHRMVYHGPPRQQQQQQPSPGLSASFIYAAPRSQSPLSFVTNSGVSTGPLSAAAPIDSRPPASMLLSPTSTTPARSSSFDGDVSAVMRLAFQYASAVASSSDPHTDPELEHMRQMFSTVANSDGSLAEDWWMTAGIAPYLADDNDTTNNNNAPTDGAAR